MDFQFGVTSIPDIDDDGVEDVIVGSRDTYVYCISGKGDSLIFNKQFSDWLYTVNVIPSIDGNNSYDILAGTRDGNVACFSGGTDFVTNTENPIEIPENYYLSQNFPNPFNPTTNIGFKITTAGLVSLKVYDILGREVTVLVNEYKQPGVFKVDFNASSLASGIYFYTLTAADFVSTKKMVLLK
jgi:hypothetical protein